MRISAKGVTRIDRPAFLPCLLALSITRIVTNFPFTSQRGPAATELTIYFFCFSFCDDFDEWKTAIAFTLTRHGERGTGTQGPFAFCKS